MAPDLTGCGQGLFVCRDTINQAQYSILVTVVIASAVFPTIVAQIWFQPREVGLRREAEFFVSGTAEHFLHMPEE